MLIAVQLRAADSKPPLRVQAAHTAQTAAYQNPNITEAQHEQRRDAVAAACAAWERNERLAERQYIKMPGVQPGPPITRGGDG
jgi:hypothetical protein